MKRLLMTRRLPDAVEAAARAQFDVTLQDRVDGLSQAEAAAALRDFDAILPTLGDDFAAATFDAAGDVRCGVLANFGVGYNHIDAEAAARHGVKVSNTPDTVTDATADVGLLLILMAARRAGEAERIVRAGGWDGWSPMSMLGTHVTGKTVGIVGFGRIGQAVARRCHFGFGMEVKYFNRSPKPADFPATQVEDLHALLGGCDFVVITVPGGGANTNLIDATALEAMRSDAILINIARGDIVDEPALIKALSAGQIKAAGLDVYAQEPVVPDGLKALENVVLLPHIGTSALEVRTAMGMMALDNIVAWSEGRALPNAV